MKTTTTMFATMLSSLSLAGLSACDKRGDAATEVPGSTGTSAGGKAGGECLHSEGCCGGHTPGDGSCGAAKADDPNEGDAASPTARQRFEWTVPPGKFAEINLELDDGATMTASFDADAPLAWNVHSHPGETPTIHAEGSDAKGTPTHAVEKGGLYSYLWANKGSKPVKLVVELRIEGTGKVHSTHP